MASTAQDLRSHLLSMVYRRLMDVRYVPLTSLAHQVGHEAKEEEEL